MNYLAKIELMDFDDDNSLTVLQIVSQDTMETFLDMVHSVDPNNTIDCGYGTFHYVEVHPQDLLNQITFIALSHEEERVLRDTIGDSFGVGPDIDCLMERIEEMLEDMEN